MCKMGKRVAACAIVLTAWTSLAAADYPDKLIRITVSSPAGGGTDLMARRIGQQMSESWGQPVVVENKNGAGGGIGAQAVARSEPSGYSLLLAAGTNMTVGAQLYKWSENIRVDPVKDFVPITGIASAPYLVLVHKSVPAQTLAQLIALIQGKKDFSFGSATVSSPDHLAGVLFKQMARLPNLTHIPYKGGAAAATDLSGGHVPMAFTTIPSALPFIQGQSVRALAVTSTRRSKELPNVPTVAETLPGYEMLTWYGLWAPAATPAPVVDKLYTEVKRIINLPDMVAFMRRDGFDAVGSTSAEFSEFVKRENARFSELIISNNVRIE